MLDDLHRTKVRQSEIRNSERSNFHFGVFNLLQLAAGKHADDRNFGQETLMKQGLMWVLFRVRLEFNAKFNPAKNVEIQTHVKDVRGVTSQREFILIQEGEELGGATSIWYCLDAGRRRPTRVPQQFLDLMVPVDQLGTKKPVQKIEQNSQRADYTQNFIASTKDEDMAGHINNASYLRWVFQDLETLESCEVKVVDVNYLQEGKAGESLCMERSAIENGHLLYSFKNIDKNITICLVKIEFQ